jgi:competence protein ComEC
VSSKLFGAVLLLFGAQQCCLGQPLLGVACLLLGLGKIGRMAPVLFALIIAVGLCSGLRERALMRRPPAPRGDVTVQAASWQVRDNWASFSGQAANGVPVTGIVDVTAKQRREIARFAGPVRLRWLKSTRIAAPQNLAEFNYRAFAWRQNHQAYQVKLGQLQFTRVPGGGLLSLLQRLRLGILRRIAQLPKRVRAYAQALLLGVMNEDAADMRTDFSKLGILHLFSVSGLHIFAIVGLAYGILCRLRVTKEACDNLLLTVLPALLIIIPMSTGLLRAVVMRMLAIGASKWHLPLTTFDCYCLVLGGNLLWRPQILATMGGQLTYLLTLVLIVGEQAGGLKQCLTMAAVSTPPLLSGVYGVHVLTFCFNFLLMPLFETIIMPLLLILVLWPHCPLVGAVNHAFLLLDQFLHQLAALPGYLLIGQLPAALALLMTLALLLYLGKRRRWPLIAAIVVAIVVLNWRPNWRVSMFALGSGEAVLIEAPFKRQAVLIGSGGNDLQLDSQKAERVIVNYLHARGIARLDALVLAPATRLYVGDARPLIAAMRPRLLLTTVAAGQTRLVRRALRGQQAPVLTVHPGTALPLGRLQLQILATSGRKTRGGLLMYAKIDNKNWLINTSVPAAVQQDAVQTAQFPVHFAVLGAHGAQAGVSAALLKQMRPQAVFVEALTSGFNKLPSAMVASAVQRNAPLVRTDEAGMIWVEANTVHMYRQENQ